MTKTIISNRYVELLPDHLEDLKVHDQIRYRDEWYIVARRNKLVLDSMSINHESEKDGSIVLVPMNRYGEYLNSLGKEWWMVNTDLEEGFADPETLLLPKHRPLSLEFRLKAPFIAIWFGLSMFFNSIFRPHLFNEDGYAFLYGKNQIRRWGDCYYRGSNSWYVGGKGKNAISFGVTGVHDR